ncbi:MAG: TssN family type VI secretion system protein [Bacteroidota bacterium]
MRELVIIIWGILLLVATMGLRYGLKRQQRQLGKYVMYHKIGVVVLSFGTGLLLYWLLLDSPHLTWALRLLALSLGAVNVGVMYRQAWSQRFPHDQEQDGFLPELLFQLISGLLAATAIVTAPQVLELVPYAEDLSRYLWDLPLVFILPFLVAKFWDLSTQVPYQLVENPWVYPIEPVTPENWPWRNLMQVNFQVRSSLREEYLIFRRSARPWIEAPKEVALGKVFCLVMQERRKRADLTSIQDMGTEYAGDPQFCWLFSIKRIWWRPDTWFRKPRFLNPDLSILVNQVREGDVIIARRIPWRGESNTFRDYRDDTGYDPDKTVIVNR